MSKRRKYMEKVKYTVEEFCKKYNRTNVEQMKGKLIADVMNLHYVPYENKITICEMIIESSYYKINEKNGIKVKKLHVNSPAKYMLYCLNLVSNYTNIKVDFKNALKDFNLLNECEVLDIIYGTIPEKELKEFRMVLDMVENDVMQNEYETHAFISNQAERFGELFGSIISPAIEQLNNTLESMDEKTVEKMFDKLKGLNGFKGKLNLVK
jgi:hypothetical protein